MRAGVVPKGVCDRRTQRIQRAQQCSPLRTQCINVRNEDLVLARNRVQPRFQIVRVKLDRIRDRAEEQVNGLRKGGNFRNIGAEGFCSIVQEGAFGPSAGLCACDESDVGPRSAVYLLGIFAYGGCSIEGGVEGMLLRACEPTLGAVGRDSKTYLMYDKFVEHDTGRVQRLSG